MTKYPLHSLVSLDDIVKDNLLASHNFRMSIEGIVVDVMQAEFNSNGSIDVMIIRAGGEPVSVWMYGDELATVVEVL